VAVIAIVLIIVFATGKKDGYQPQIVKAQRGLFEIIVTDNRELEAENNIKIEGPAGMLPVMYVYEMWKFRIWSGRYRCEKRRLC
jgi:hypothetical protein